MVGGFSKIPEAHPGESARRIFMGYDDGELWKTNMLFCKLACLLLKLILR